MYQKKVYMSTYVYYGEHKTVLHMHGRHWTGNKWWTLCCCCLCCTSFVYMCQLTSCWSNAPLLGCLPADQTICRIKRTLWSIHWSENFIRLASRQWGRTMSLQQLEIRHKTTKKFASRVAVTMPTLIFQFHFTSWLIYWDPSTLCAYQQTHDGLVYKYMILGDYFFYFLWWANLSSICINLRHRWCANLSPVCAMVNHLFCSIVTSHPSPLYSSAISVQLTGGLFAIPHFYIFDSYILINMLFCISH